MSDDFANRNQPVAERPQGVWLVQKGLVPLDPAAAGALVDHGLGRYLVMSTSLYFANSPDPAVYYAASWVAMLGHAWAALMRDLDGRVSHEFGEGWWSFAWELRQKPERRAPALTAYALGGWEALAALVVARPSYPRVGGSLLTEVAL